MRQLSTLSHPNVLSPIAVLLDSDICIIVPYMANGNLQSLLESVSVPLNGPERLRMARQIGDGLLYLHANDVIHRSLTATNVLIAHDGALMLSDFGLCELKDAVRHSTQQLGRHPSYLAPVRHLFFLLFFASHLSHCL